MQGRRKRRGSHREREDAGAFLTGARCPRCGLAEPHVCLDARASDCTRTGLPTGGWSMVHRPRPH